MKIRQTYQQMSHLTSVGMLLATLSVASGFYSCSDEVTHGTGTVGDSIVAEITPLPTTDQLDEKFEKTAMVFGDNRTGFNGSLVNRMTNTTDEISSAVRAFIFSKGYTSHFTVDEVTAMFKAYRKNATFVLVDPVNTDRSALLDTLQKALELASAKGEDVTLPTELLTRFAQLTSQAGGSEDSQAEAVAINRNGTYVVPNMYKSSKKQSDNGSIEQVSEDGDTIRIALADQDYAPSGYDYGKAADMLVQWMTRCADAGTGSFSTGGTSDGTPISAQMVTLQQTLGPTRALDRKMLYELNFEIYSFHKGDTNEDYYLVHCTPTYHNSQLECLKRHTVSEKWENYWYVTDKNIELQDGSTLNSAKYWYGPYFRGGQIALNIEPSGEAGEEISLSNPLPSTDLSGGNKLSSGLNFKLSNVSGVNSSFWGGQDNQTVTLAQTFTHQNAGLRCVQNGASGNYVEWVFSGESPDVTYTDFGPNIQPLSVGVKTRSQSVDLNVFCKHTLINDFQKDDLAQDLTCAFVVKNPKPLHSYNLHLKDMVLVGEMYGYLKDNKYKQEALTWIDSEQSIPLYQPVRSVEYEIECSDATFFSRWEQQIKDRLKEAFAAEWNGNYPAFSVYGLNDNARLSKAKDVFYNFSQVIYVVANRYKINDTLTFTLRAKGATESILHFNLEGGHIK